MRCIFCDQSDAAISEEHIVPESLGNEKYIIKLGAVCDTCNHRFSNFEKTALTNSGLLFERARLGIKSKKGKPAKGSIDNLDIEGDSDFRKQVLSIKGLSNKNFKNFNPQSNKGQLFIPTFSGSEVQMSKLILKIGIESLYHSQRKIYDRFDFTDAKLLLTNQSIVDWPILISELKRFEFKSVPTHFEKYYLRLKNCELKYKILADSILLFSFKYGVVALSLNLINRDLEWLVQTTLHKFNYLNLFPLHYRKKLQIKLKRIEH